MMLPVDHIHIRPDARTLDQATVTGLVESIANVGLINAIRVRAVDDQWELIAGGHRLEAHKRLGLAEIEAIVVDDDDLRAELAMIDENLCRAELTAADRAKQTARRKAIYLELHPDTGHGGDRKSDQADNLSTRSFAAEVAAATGKDERTVRRDAERGEKIYAPVFDLIAGTALEDNGSFLDRIKNLSPSEQMQATKSQLAWIKQQEREKAKRRAGGIAGRYKPTAEPLTDEEAAEKQYAALVSVWNKAGETARQRFRELIDEPVMDRRFA